MSAYLVCSFINFLPEERQLKLNYEKGIELFVKKISEDDAPIYEYVKKMSGYSGVGFFSVTDNEYGHEVDDLVSEIVERWNCQSFEDETAIIEFCRIITFLSKMIGKLRFVFISGSYAIEEEFISIDIFENRITQKMPQLINNLAFLPHIIANVKY